MTFHNRDSPTTLKAPFFSLENSISNSSYMAGQCALRSHVEDNLLGAQPESTMAPYNQQISSPMTSTSLSSSTAPVLLQAPLRATRPSNAFMLFRSEFVKQHKHLGQRQQELSIRAACAWRELGTDGQTGWYEKAALAKDKSDIKYTEIKATRQRSKPYRPRANTDTMRPVRDTYATLGPVLSTPRRTWRKCADQLIPPSNVAMPVQILEPTVRGITSTSSSSLAHALSPLPPLFSGHYPNTLETRVSPLTQSDTSYGSLNIQHGTSPLETSHIGHVVSSPISTSASTAPWSAVGSLSPQSFPSTPDPSPLSPADWVNGLDEPHYNLSNTLWTTSVSHRPAAWFYDENVSRQDPFRRHTSFF